MRYVSGGIRRVKGFVLRNPVRKWRIRRTQHRLLEANYGRSSEKIIVILTPGADIVKGGILSIASIYTETLNLKDIHQSQVLLCTIPGELLILRYSKFKNDNNLFELSAVLRHFTNVKALMIHIPEYAIESFLKSLSSEDWQIIAGIEDLRINVMLQNIKHVKDFGLFDRLRTLGNVSCTTAHEKYTSAEIRLKVGSPLHKLSTYVSPEHYDRRAYHSKKNLMVVSPDPNPRKTEILRRISQELPSLEMKIIKKMPYEEFKVLVANAKWALTFGEGLDNYFIETVFSGGISFAVFNQAFFTGDFGSLATVYQDLDHLAEQICSDIKNLDNEQEYQRYQDLEYQLCSRYYSYKEYLHNLELFYEGKFTYP